MYVYDKFHHKEQLALDVCEEGFFESKFCEVDTNTKFKILLSGIYRVTNTSDNYFRNHCTGNRVCYFI